MTSRGAVEANHPDQENDLPHWGKSEVSEDCKSVTNSARKQWSMDKSGKRLINDLKPLLMAPGSRLTCLGGPLLKFHRTSMILMVVHDLHREEFVDDSMDPISELRKSMRRCPLRTSRESRTFSVARVQHYRRRIELVAIAFATRIGLGARSSQSESINHGKKS